MLNRSGKIGHPWSLRKSFSFLPLHMMLAVCFSYMAFITLRCTPSIPSLLRVFFFFSWKDVKFGQMLFMPLLRWTYDFYPPFCSYDVSILFIDLWMLNHLCIHEINPPWLCCMILLMCCWIWFSNILLRICASM